MVVYGRWTHLQEVLLISLVEEPIGILVRWSLAYEKWSLREVPLYSYLQSVTSNSLSKDYPHLDDHAKQITDTPGFKPIIKKGCDGGIQQ